MIALEGREDLLSRIFGGGDSTPPPPPPVLTPAAFDAVIGVRAKSAKKKGS